MSFVAELCGGPCDGQMREIGAMYVDSRDEYVAPLEVWVPLLEQNLTFSLLRYRRCGPAAQSVADFEDVALRVQYFLDPDGAGTWLEPFAP